MKEKTRFLINTKRKVTENTNGKKIKTDNIGLSRYYCPLTITSAKKLI